MTSDYIIKNGPEVLRKPDYCFDCNQLMNAGEKIFFIVYGSKVHEWAKVHDVPCAQNSPHWDIWTKEINSTEEVSQEDINNYKIVILPKGQYPGKNKYSVVNRLGKNYYTTSREERARGVEEFLNSFPGEL